MTTSLCPVCDSTRVPSIWTLSGSRTGQRAPVKLCLGCGFMFQRTGYSEDDAMLKLDFQWHLDKIDSHQVHSDAIIARMREIQPQGSSLLDIGCGVGVSLRAAHKAGLTALGVEPNRHATDYATRQLGLNVIQGYFAQGLIKQRFDYVILDMVLEHVPDPQSLVSATMGVLAPGGVLYLAVPNRDKGWARIPYSLLFPRQSRSLFLDNDVHINHFSRSNIDRLVAKHGAHIVAGRSGAYFIRGR